MSGIIIPTVVVARSGTARSTKTICLDDGSTSLTSPQTLAISNKRLQSGGTSHSLRLSQISNNSPTVDEEWCIKVAFEEVVLSPRERMNGVVYLNLSEEFAAARSLELAIIGRERTNVKWQSDTAPKAGNYSSKQTLMHHDLMEHIFLELRKTVASFDGHPAGMFEYPFSFTLGDSVPTSLKEHYDGNKEKAFHSGGNRGGWCNLEYFVEAKLQGTELITGTTFIVQCVDTQVKDIEPSWFHREESFDSTRCCVFTKYGSISLSAAMDKDGLQTGEDYTLLWNVSNDSGCAQESLHLSVGLSESIECVHRGNRKWVVTSGSENVYRLFPTPQLLSTKHRRGSQVSIDRGDGEIHKTPTNKSKVVPDEAVKPVSVHIPGTFRSSYMGTHMHCTHRIEVVLHTGLGHRDPVVTIPVHLKSKAFPAASEHRRVSHSHFKDHDPVDETYAIHRCCKVHFPENWQPQRSEILHLGTASLIAK